MYLRIEAFFGTLQKSIEKIFVSEWVKLVLVYLRLEAFFGTLQKSTENIFVSELM